MAWRTPPSGLVGNAKDDFGRRNGLVSIGAIFAVEEGILGGAIAAQLGWTPLIAFAFMVFCLLYVPCVAAIGVIRGETNSWKWAGFAALYTTVVAWIAATLIYQIGRLFIT